MPARISLKRKKKRAFSFHAVSKFHPLTAGKFFLDKHVGQIDVNSI
jgi:hypothetical protein